MTIAAYDTEFYDDGHSIDLLSIGIVTDDGREYEAVSMGAPWPDVAAHPWLRDNVLPHLPMLRPHVPALAQPDPEDTRVKPLQVIANEVRDFLRGPADANELPHVELWADHAAYDHVVLCHLWGTMDRLPEHIPMFTRDVQQEAARTGAALPEPDPATAHGALADARHTMNCLHALGITPGGRP